MSNHGEHRRPPIAQPAPPSVGSAPGTPKRGPVARVKAWAWRITASYVWVHLLLSIVSGRDMLAGIERATANKVVTLLASMGFAPTNAAHLPMVFIATWLLFITSLKPLQLFIGLPLYVIFAPLAFLIVTVFQKFWKVVRKSLGRIRCRSQYPRGGSR